MSLSEVASLAKKQIILPDISRGFKYARWKLQNTILQKALKQQGLTTEKLEKELKLIHNISSAAYKNHEIICSSFSFQLFANFSFGLSVSSFIIFLTALIICGSLNHIKQTLYEYDMISKLIINSITIKNVLIICAICSIITVLFGYIGIYISFKSHENCFNQYTQCILSVHEHIHDRLLTKYENQGIKWKLFVHYKDTKRLSIFGRKEDITYYGIIVQVIEHNQIDNVYNIYNIDDTSDTTNDEYVTTSDDTDIYEVHYNNTKQKQIPIQSSSNLQNIGKMVNIKLLN